MFKQMTACDGSDSLVTDLEFGAKLRLACTLGLSPLNNFKVLLFLKAQQEEKLFSFRVFKRDGRQKTNHNLMIILLFGITGSEVLVNVFVMLAIGWFSL